MGDVLGVIFYGQVFFSFKLEGNITLSSIVSYVTTVWGNAKITID